MWSKVVSLVLGGLIIFAGVFGVWAVLTTLSFHSTFTVGDNISFRVYENNIERTAESTTDFGSLTLGEPKTSLLSIFNNGNVRLTVTVLIANVPLDWTCGWIANNTFAEVSSWLNGTLSFLAPVTTQPGSYTATITVNVVKA